MITEDFRAEPRGLRRRASRIAVAAVAALVMSLPASIVFGFQKAIVLNADGGTYTISRTIDRKHPEIATATLNGRVVDELKAAIPNARIDLINKSTNQSVSVVSGTDGSWTLKGIEPGNYDLQIVSNYRYRRFNHSGLTLKARDIILFNAKVELSNMTLGLLLMAN